MEDKEREDEMTKPTETKQAEEKEDDICEDESTCGESRTPDDPDIRELIARAEERGEIRGRNARIAELMREIHDSDGVPHPGSGRQTFRQPTPSSIFDLAKYAR